MLLQDELHDFTGFNGSPSRCRVRVYLPAEGSGHDTYIVILTDDKDAFGTSITNMVEYLAAPLCARFRIPAERAVFIEHYDYRRATGRGQGTGQAESFSRVLFRVPAGGDKEAADYIHELTLGKPDWRHTDKQSVEQLIDCTLP